MKCFLLFKYKSHNHTTQHIIMSISLSVSMIFPFPLLREMRQLPRSIDYQNLPSEQQEDQITRMLDLLLETRERERAVEVDRDNYFKGMVLIPETTPPMPFKSRPKEEVEVSSRTCPRCPICLSDKKLHFNQTSCGHYICRACTKKQFPKIHTLCPMCRTQVTHLHGVKKYCYWESEEEAEAEA
jgi:hypothetical protein